MRDTTVNNQHSNRHSARDRYSNRRQILDRTRNEAASSGATRTIAEITESHLENLQTEVPPTNIPYAPSRAPDFDWDTILANLERMHTPYYTHGVTRGFTMPRTASAEDRVVTTNIPPLERVPRREPTITEAYVMAHRAEMERAARGTLNRDFDGDVVNSVGLMTRGIAQTPQGLVDLEANNMTATMTGQIRINDSDGNELFGNLDTNGRWADTDRGTLAGRSFFDAGAITSRRLDTENPMGWRLDPQMGTIRPSGTAISSFEKQIIEFLKNKVSLNVNLSQLSAGLELKVTLSLNDGTELMSAEDFLKVD